ncbi:MAG TPA: polyprenol monophosphomannose synthase [Patescibacteria group bacterium]|nr:polyprenol monophosphomannose synthase [Patescibacteria group bacterium]
MKTVILIPTYNERDNIRGLIEGIVALYPQADILAIDDNSPDGTGQAIVQLCQQHPHIYAIHRNKKSGLASAYLEGLAWASQRPYEYFVLMDADFSHHPRYIAKLLEKAQGGVDVVIGSRYAPAGKTEGWSVWRLVLSRLANYYSRRLLGLHVRDLTSGFKCLRKRVLEGVNFSMIRSNGYAFQIEMAYFCWKKGFRVEEYPITFFGRKKGKSKLSFRLLVEAFFLVLRLRFTGDREYGQGRE